MFIVDYDDGYICLHQTMSMSPIVIASSFPEQPLKAKLQGIRKGPQTIQQQQQQQQLHPYYILRSANFIMCRV